jgi:hypothetical protein
MTERQPVSSLAGAVLAGLAMFGGGLSQAGQAAADPAPPPPAPAAPGTPAPGQPVVSAADGPTGPVAPPPGGPPPVPEIQNPVYGQGQTPGQLGYLRDLWHTFHSGNPVEALTAPPDEVTGPPPGAGPAPKLPPGYTSLTDPGSSTPVSEGPKTGGPALPPGFYPLNGPPPPGWYDQQPGSAPASPPGGPPPPVGFVAGPPPGAPTH